MIDPDPIFRPVTKDQPCPVCGKPDWCRVSAGGRIECHRPTTGDVPGFRRLTIERTGGNTTRSGFAMYRPCDDPIFQKTSTRPVVARNGTARTVSTSETKERPTSESNAKSAAFPSVADYIATLGDRCGGGHIYHGADGLPAMAVVRINHPDGGKEFRPLHPAPGGWAFGDPAKPLPLYRLPELATASEVIVCEGEKAADAAASISMTATTSSHGASAPGSTDWHPLAGRDVVILPDADAPGRQYAECVARILSGLNPPAKCRIVALPGLPDGGDIVEWLEARECVEPADLLRELRELIDTTPHYTPTPDAAPPTDSLPADLGPPWITIAEIGERPAYRCGLQPITTGYECLDVALRGGFRPECQYPLAGRTGSAKTTFALNIGRRVALAGYAVLIFKLEESPTEAVWRMHAATAQVPFTRLLDGPAGATDSEREKLGDAWQLLRGLPIRMSDARDLSTICRITRQHAESGGRLVIVDQLSHIDVGDVSSAYERATLASNTLRRMSVECRLPVVVVCQVNRPAAKNEARLSCHDLRDSGAIENDAAGVILIDRATEPTNQWRSAEPIRELQVLIGKNRYGACTGPDDDPIRLTWHPRCCRIEEPERPTGAHPF